MKPVNHHRRKLLQGGLAGLTLPPLASLANTKSVTHAAADKPARLVTIFFPNGVSLPPEDNVSFKDWHWFPHNPGTDYEMTKTLQPLAAHRSHLSILSGFSHSELRSTVPHSCSGNFLTGTEKLAGFSNLISCDQLFAEQIEGATRFSSLALSTDGGTGGFGNPATLSVDRYGALVPALSDPKQIFDRLFSIDAGGLEQRARAIARDRSILDRVTAPVTRLNVELAADDRHHLDAYLTATRTLERQLERANDWLTVPKPEVDSGLFDFDAEPTRELGTNYLRTMYDLIHMALLTDSTRVVTYKMAKEAAGSKGNNLPYAAGLSLHHHQLTHSAARDEGGWERWAKYDQYMIGRFSEFLTKMSETPDPLAEGSLLDNTIVLFGSATSKTHVGRNYPLILAGGSNLGLKHGAFHKFEEERPFSDVLLTVLQQLGVDIEHFGEGEHRVDQILAGL